ncbi:unnamed protein product, partial [Medioppia subpectinata]
MTLTTTLRPKQMKINLNNNFNHDYSNYKKAHKLEIIWWPNVVAMVILYMAGLYGLYRGMFYAKPITIIYMYVMVIFTALGIQCGVHRLWCHRSYKANRALQYIIMTMFTLALQDNIYKWSRDHRTHHKYSDTDADPHNINRGFFFSHVGWLLSKKHPDVIKQGTLINMTDLDRDQLVQFHRRHYPKLVAIIWAAIPTLIPYYLWGETLWDSYFVGVMLRYLITTNFAMCINSMAHTWGYKPYDNTVNPTECYVRHMMFGEGFHNYHHTDYGASEFGPLEVFNLGTLFIDFFAWLGWAYDMRRASTEMVDQRKKRTGNLGWVKSSRLYELFTVSLVSFMVCTARMVISDRIPNRLIKLHISRHVKHHRHLPYQ